MHPFTNARLTQKLVAIVGLLMFCWPAPRLVLHSHEVLGDSQESYARFVEHLTTHHSEDAYTHDDPAKFHFHWCFPSVDDVICSSYAFACEFDAPHNSDSLFYLIVDLSNGASSVDCRFDIKHDWQLHCNFVLSEDAFNQNANLLTRLTKWNC